MNRQTKPYTKPLPTPLQPSSSSSNLPQSTRPKPLLNSKPLPVKSISSPSSSSSRVTVTSSKITTSSKPTTTSNPSPFPLPCLHCLDSTEYTSYEDLAYHYFHDPRHKPSEKLVRAWGKVGGGGAVVTGKGRGVGGAGKGKARAKGGDGGGELRYYVPTGIYVFSSSQSAYIPSKASREIGHLKCDCGEPFGRLLSQEDMRELLECTGRHGDGEVRGGVGRGVGVSEGDGEGRVLRSDWYPAWRRRKWAAVMGGR